MDALQLDATLVLVQVQNIVLNVNQDVKVPYVEMVNRSVNVKKNMLSKKMDRVSYSIMIQNAN
jgi:hypothetical protein